MEKQTHTHMGSAGTNNRRESQQSEELQSTDTSSNGMVKGRTFIHIVLFQMERESRAYYARDEVSIIMSLESWDKCEKDVYRYPALR